MDQNPDHRETEVEASMVLVVVNGEGQFSVWEASTPVPAGWEPTGFAGTREHCLQHIAEIWTDMRPMSLRKFHDEQR